MFIPRWYQNEAVESLFEYFRTHPIGNPVVGLPTGTGKSLVIAEFIRRVLSMWPTQRFLNLTHVKELVDQNARTLQAHWPAAPIGINSAGLRQRDYIQPVLFAGVGSIARSIQQLGHRDLVLIDECHLVSPNGTTRYRIVLDELAQINPYVRAIGFTATPYRLGQGHICDDGLFTDMCYDMTDVDGFGRLLAEGFLAMLRSKKTAVQLDISSVGISNGDYKQGELQNAVNDRDVTYRALIEMCEHGYDRRSWLVFAAGVEHAESIAQLLRDMGVPTAAVHAKLKSGERDAIIHAFKTGQIRCVVNNNVLTTGFDHPPIDLIGMFRPTVSTGLWVQMLGRGTRPSADTGKRDCLVMDFARNTERLGPINDPVIPKKKKGEPGDAPIKICEMCGEYNHASARVCTGCGFVFEMSPKITASASEAELIRTDAPLYEKFNVDKVMYGRHEKNGKPDTIRVSYYCGLQRFQEWICLEHGRMAGHKAREWWRQRHAVEPPETTAEALQLTSQLKVPAQIEVWTNRSPYPEIVGHEF